MPERERVTILGPIPDGTIIKATAGVDVFWGFHPDDIAKCCTPDAEPPIDIDVPE